MTTSFAGDVLSPARLDPVRLAAAAYLARFKGQSRVHTESDLRAYLIWCVERGVEPLAATRPYVELYVRWMQEHRRLAASTVSRRLCRRERKPVRQHHPQRSPNVRVDHGHRP